MDEPRSRLPVILAATPIIAESRHRPLWMRLRDGALTGLLWLVYLYLIRDFLRFLAEGAGWALGAALIPEQAGLAAPLFPTLGSYALIALANATILISWALYNQTRFRGRERRKASPRITPEDLALMYGVDERDVFLWQEARILVMHHDEDGRLIKVDLPEPST